MNEEQLARRWIEIREESTVDTIVLHADGPRVPPGRGRRVLDLHSGGRLQAMIAGPNDRQTGQLGVWKQDDGDLVIEAPGWEGCYEVRELSQDRLMLRRK